MTADELARNVVCEIDRRGLAAAFDAPIIREIVADAIRAAVAAKREACADMVAYKGEVLRYECDCYDSFCNLADDIRSCP